MKIVVCASEKQKEELAPVPAADVEWVNDITAFATKSSAGAFVDLLYVNTPERNHLLQALLPRPVIVNGVADTLAETNPAFVRINGWATFLSSPVLEAACCRDESKAATEAVFSFFNKTIEWLPDEPGFVAARVVSMIVNEAYLALAEGVSTREEIDTAMRLGTAYPFGPFEWADKIGWQHVATLLQKLSAISENYTPAALLLQEANQKL